MGTSSPDTIILLAFVAGFAVLALLFVTFLWQAERRRTHARIEQLLEERSRDLSDARKDSVERSRSSLKGQIAEQMAPLLRGFRYAPADARFLGDPIDYVVFNGYSDVRDNRGPDAGLEIVLLEVKQGGSSLSPFQRAIARSVEAGRVRFEILRVGHDGSLATETWQPRRSAGYPPGSGDGG
jgi:predicted Holliday junction resolvase-like endonuclease